MDVGIIGGGIMGLVLGYRLSQAGFSVHILESAPQLGGLATWAEYGDFTWDKYYHVILRSDTNILNLLEELELGHHVKWKTTKTGFLWQGKLLSMSNHWEFLTFPALNLFQKVRLAGGLLYCQHFQDPAQLHTIKAKEWLTKIFGKRVYNTIWEPLLQSKFGQLKEKIPASIMCSTINRYASTRSKGDGQEVMGYLSGGLKTLIERLSEVIIEKGGTITCNSQVKEIENLPYDRLISTIPTVALKKIAPQLNLPEAKPNFLGVIRLALVLKEPLSPYYVTNIIDKGMPFTGIIELTSVIDSKECKGKRLVMLPRYDVPESKWFDKSDEEITAAFLEEMRRVWPEIDRNLIRSSVARAKYVQPIWTDSLPPKRDIRVTDKIWNINSELSSGHTLSNNGIIEIANKAAEEFV